RLWADLPGAAPIVAVSNGVHPWTWQDARVRIAYGSGELLAAHAAAKRDLLATVRGRTGVVLDETRPVLGFPPPAAAYQRADLVFRDVERIAPLLHGRKLQIVFSGKAHPHDEAGKRILAQLAAAARTFRDSVVYLDNYDLRLAQIMARGSDVWLSTPRRPM